MNPQNNRDQGEPLVSTRPVKTPRQLSRETLLEIVTDIQGRMYLDLDNNGSEVWNLEKAWNCGDLCQEIQDILQRYDLVPIEEQPCIGTEFSTTDELQQLLNFAEASGVETYGLDGAVHDCVSDDASEINNAGLREQIAFLLDRLGSAETKELLAQLGKPSVIGKTS